MRLGFHYHIPALEKDGQIYMPGYFGRFIDGLAQNCDSVICFLHTPTHEEENQMDFALTSRNVILVGLGPHQSIPQRLARVYKIMRIVKLWRNQLDCMLIRGPSPLLPFIAHACNSLPISLLLVSDQLAGVDDLDQPGWRKVAIRLWWRWNYRCQLPVARRSLTFVNSNLLFQQFQGIISNLVETQTTTLTPNDFFFRENTCQSNPIHLLYTGRMDRTKGILDILESVAELVYSGEDIILNLVGPLERGDSVLEDMKSKAALLGISKRVCYHGYQPIGPALSSFYNSADIYIIASQSSEGFPRTIWEAMAHGLPVIATSVGSIPYYLEDGKNAIIVSPKSPKSLADAILRLINNPQLRTKLMKNAYTIAKTNTIEIRAKEMIGRISNWLITENGKR